MNLNNLLRANIKNFTPYLSARTEYAKSKGILLDANENSIGSVLNKAVNRYPDPLQTRLRKKIAGIKGIKKEEIFLGNGSDEAVDLLIRAFCEPRRDKIIICPPTYGVYAVFAQLNNVEVIEVPLVHDFQLNLEAIIGYQDTSVKLIFLCSPNNPTGNILNSKDIRYILQNFTGLVVLDEAYIDFAKDTSWLKQLQKYPNLVILQTFSKAWGMANLRLGMALSRKDIIAVLNRIKYPYNLSGIIQKLAIKALDHEQVKNDMVKKLFKQRQFLIKQLSSLPCVIKVYSSDANFLLVKFKNSIAVFQRLLENKIIVRDRSKVLNCENCLRITVGTRDENIKLIKILKYMDV